MRKRIFWAGGSTAAQNTINSYPQTGIGQVMQLYLKEDVVVYNYAKNGRSTKSFINQGILDKIKEEN
jgi:lysophospholipase L1-like esterase